MTSLSYLSRFDGLRAVAVFGVLIEHFCPLRVLTRLSPGGAGVTLFFVLSGFLITRILVNYRSQTIGSAAAQFYWRRFLRLSPPLFLAITIAALLNLSTMRSDWWVHALYLTNFQIGLNGSWVGSADHFWSLCTEEQFYLLWFLVVILLPRSSLFYAIIVAFAVTLTFRAFVYFSQLPALTTVLLPGNLASLAAGALLLEAQTSDRFSRLNGVLTDRKWLIVTAILFGALSISMRFVDLPRAIFYPFVASAFFACLLAAAANERPDPYLDWLHWRPLRYLGKISYGIFVYHMFLPSIIGPIPGLHWIASGSWLAFVALVVISITLAHFSWVFIEAPILQYKDRVPVRPRSAARAGITSAVARPRTPRVNVR
jgi:peptidoglycan/LPS O-acetylase OafA/YrhL